MTAVSSERSPLPATVIVLDEGAVRHVALRALLPASTAVVAARDAHVCRGILRGSAGTAVISTVPAEPQGEPLSARLALRRQFPFAPMLPFFVDGESDPLALDAMIVAGMRLVMTTETLSERDAIATLLRRAAALEVSADIWQRAAIDLAEPATTLLQAALRLAHAPITLARLANAAQLHERTLRKVCVKHGLPSPQWIIGWARCLTAAYYLEEPGRSIESVAALLAFGSPVNLTNHLRRYTGMPASSCRAAGPLTAVAAALRRQMQSGAAP